MYPDQKMDKIIEKYKHRIEVSIITICVVIIVICCVYAYIVRPINNVKRVKSNIEIGYKPFSMYIENTKGTLEWNEQKVSDYVDDYNLRHVHYKTWTSK